MGRTRAAEVVRGSALQSGARACACVATTACIEQELGCVSMLNSEKPHTLSL